MVGYGANRGIVPQVCDEIFKRIDNNHDDNLSFQVEFSMLEIYNERIQDLLEHDPARRPQGGLKVRETRKKEIYVEGLLKAAVGSYEEINAKMQEGYESRSIGSTLMN